VEIKVEGIESEADLEEWIGLGLVFNKMLPEK
jgi:hypothetical protein